MADRSTKLNRRQLIFLLLLLAGLAYIILRPARDGGRAPAPTPVNQDVHEIAP